MPEKFDNFKNEEFEYSEEEYNKALLSLFLDASMNIFETIKKQYPIFAEHLKNDYEEYINNLLEYFNQNKSIKGFNNYILSINKNNQWVNAMMTIGEMLVSQELSSGQYKDLEERSINQHIKELILKMRKGLDKQ
ncbi:MAG: hypothetical protein ACPL3E_00465 [Minisyncoccia bacterium]